MKVAEVRWSISRELPEDFSNARRKKAKVKVDEMTISIIFLKYHVSSLAFTFIEKIWVKVLA